MKRALCWMIAAVVCCGVLPMGAARAAEPDGRLLARWEFDTAAGAQIADKTGNGYDLTVNTDQFYYGRGYEREAVWFAEVGETNTGKRMVFGENALETALHGQSEITVTCMFKKRCNVNALGEKDLFSLYFPSGKAALRIYLKDNQIGVGTRSDNDEGSMFTITAPFDLAGETEWHNLAVTVNYAQKTACIYLDGGLYTRADMAEKWTKHALQLGGRNAKNGLGCDAAVLDNAALYLRELSAEEIRLVAPPLVCLDASDGSNKNGGDPIATVPAGARSGMGIDGLIKVQGDANQFTVKNGGLGKRLTQARPDGVSIGMWVKGVLPSSQKPLFRVMNTGGVAAMDIKLDQNSKIEYGGRSDGDETNGREPYSSSAAVVPWDDRVWHHLLCATDYANQKRYLYFDGVLVLETDTAYRKQAYENGYSEKANDCFGIEGMAVDGLTLYARVLSQEEVTAMTRSRPAVNLAVRTDTDQWLEAGVADGRAEAVYTVYNNSDARMEGVICAALTDPETNGFRELQKVTIGGLEPGAEMTGSVWFEAARPGDEIRYFYWDSLGGRKPVVPGRCYGTRVINAAKQPEGE